MNIGSVFVARVPDVAMPVTSGLPHSVTLLIKECFSSLIMSSFQSLAFLNSSLQK